MCTYTDDITIEWDRRKADSNLRKHHVDFSDAATVLYDDLAITIREIVKNEERFVTLGIDALGRTLVVVYTWRQDRIRIISARKASSRECRRAMRFGI